MALGTALTAEEKYYDIDELISLIKNNKAKGNYEKSTPLFKSEDEYKSFAERHSKAKVDIIDEPDFDGDVYVGIDAGSTTVKAVVINDNEDIIFSKYMSNGGNPVAIIRDTLDEFYRIHPKAKIKAGTVTGYGEEIIKNAFCVDFGIVETVAHFTAAKKFRPNVDFIIDIGGQDIKCFQIKNGVIDNIFLNEACSSGCGSFCRHLQERWAIQLRILQTWDACRFACKPGLKVHSVYEFIGKASSKRGCNRREHFSGAVNQRCQECAV